MLLCYYVFGNAPLWSASWCVYFMRPNTLLLCIFLFLYFSCTVQIHKLKFKSEYYLRINMWNCVKMGTPAITLWFPEQCLLGFCILEKQLASQDMFLIRSEISITAYHFLVLYRSTSLQALSFLKNIETFLCKYKLVNNCSIPSMQQPYNHDSFSKILGASTALQSQLFCKNIENFLCK
jgi:hypothetical protein